MTATVNFAKKKKGKKGKGKKKSNIQQADSHRSAVSDDGNVGDIDDMPLAASVANNSLAPSAQKPLL